MPVETLMVEKDEIAEGVSQKTNKPYRRVVLTDAYGEKYSAFGVEMFDVAKPFEGKRAMIDWAPNGSYKDLLSVKPVENGEGPTPGPSAEQPPPQDTLSIHAETALKGAVRTLGPRAAASTAKPTEIYGAIAQLADLYFVWLQRKSGFQIDDKDVPF